MKVDTQETKTGLLVDFKGKSPMGKDNARIIGQFIRNKREVKVHVIKFDFDSGELTIELEPNI